MAGSFSPRSCIPLLCFGDPAFAPSSPPIGQTENLFHKFLQAPIASLPPAIPFHRFFPVNFEPWRVVINPPPPSRLWLLGIGSLAHSFLFSFMFSPIGFSPFCSLIQHPHRNHPHPRLPFYFFLCVFLGGKHKKVSSTLEPFWKGSPPEQFFFVSPTPLLPPTTST